MKKKIKIIWVIFTTVLSLTAMVIPVIYGSAFDKDNGDNKLDIQWYYETSDGPVEVDIPGKLDVSSNKICTIFGHIESSQLSSQTIVLRSSSSYPIPNGSDVKNLLLHRLTISRRTSILLLFSGSKSVKIWGPVASANSSYIILPPLPSVKNLS